MTIKDNTEPRLNNYIKIKFDGINVGDDIDQIKYVMRIDIQRPDTIIYFIENGNRIPYKRAGDTTAKMQPWEIEQSTKKFEERKNTNNTSCKNINIDIEAYQSGDEDYQFLKDRVISKSFNESFIVPGEMNNLKTYFKNHLYELSDRKSSMNIEYLKKIFNYSEKYIRANIDENFHYSVIGTFYQWFGNSYKNFLFDLKNMKKIKRKIERKLPDKSERLGPDESERLGIDIDYIAGYSNCRYGVFWLGVRKRNIKDLNENERREYLDISLGIIMDDIPFKTKRLEKFFECLDLSPYQYKQTTGIQNIDIRINTEIYNPKIVDYYHNHDGIKPSIIQADNPLFKKNKQLTEIPEYFRKAVTRIEKLPFRIRGGGPINIEENRFIQPNFDILYTESADVPLYLTGILCSEDLD